MINECFLQARKINLLDIIRAISGLLTALFMPTPPLEILAANSEFPILLAGFLQTGGISE